MNKNINYTADQRMSNAIKAYEYLTQLNKYSRNNNNSRNSFSSNQLAATNIEIMSNINNNLNNKQKNVYVICHSHTMKKIYKHINENICKKKKENNTENKNQNNNVKRIYDSDNLWQLVLNDKIRIFRHAYSVANMHKDKKHKFGWNQISEKDAKLSIYGIISSLEMSEKLDSSIKNDINNNSIIYVSCLIRTWMTAICLFLPIIITKKKNNENIVLNLKIADYIKESSKGPEGFMADNEPETINKQMLKIKLFVDYLKMKNRWDNEINIRVFFNDNKSRETDNITYQNIPNNIKTFLKENKDYNEYYNIINNIVKKQYQKKENNNSPKIYHSNCNNKNSFKVIKGIDKPTKDQLDKFSKWYEPFSIKSGNNNAKRMSSRFMPSFNPKRKKFYEKLKKKNNTNNETSGRKAIYERPKKLNLQFKNLNLDTMNR